jgi:thiol-disulfide isomerase/thioredoxin
MVTLNKRSERAALVAWVAVLAIFVSVGAAHLRSQVVPGNAFPSLASSGLVGNLPDTSGKVVLVDFWASWCAPCKASFPAYSRLQAAYAGRGLTVVAVSVDDSPEAYAAFVAKLKPAFVTVHDAGHKLVSVVQVPTMPTSYLVDRAGKVRFVHAAFHGDQTERELRGEIETLLGEKAPSP